MAIPSSTLPEGKHKQSPGGMVAILRIETMQHGDPHNGGLNLFRNHWAFGLALTNVTRPHECCHLTWLLLKSA